MRCPRCNFDNPTGMKFCTQCATALVGKSGERGAKSVEQEKTEPQEGSVAPRPTLHTPRAEAERRQLTVMFCDLVDSTRLAEKLDPEELREVIRAYQQVCAQVIHRFEGYIARYVGDALLVYFGYPAAHEDDAQRAVRTGLGIVAALPHLNAQLHSTFSALREFPLQVRIGIHTGLVVAGDIGEGSYGERMAIVGETPNIAARVQGLAKPSTVTITAATLRLIKRLFICRDLGSQPLKGLSSPVRLYEVLEERRIRSRFEATATGGFTPFVGRENEVALLLQRWERAKAGRGQVVLLGGEAGIGKSRLLRAMKTRITREPHTRLECRCSPYYQNSAFYPVIDVLQRRLRFAREDSPEKKLQKLRHTLQQYHLPEGEVLPLFAALLSLPSRPVSSRESDHAPSPTPTPERQKQKTQEALVTWILEEAKQQPVQLVVEDLHWVDPSTLETLSFLIEQASQARLLLLFTFRPEFVPPWSPSPALTNLTLSRLSPPQAEEMVGKITGGKPLPTDVVRQVVTKTDGVPLFIEELTKMVMESVGAHGQRKGQAETAPLQLTIPVTLHDSLMARLDRLGAFKEIAQLSAVLGREFSYELLRAVAQFDDTTLQDALTQLVEAELLYQRGQPPHAQYFFKHALIQDAAYQSLLKSKRQQYHQQIVHVLEERFAELRNTQPELLAYHCTQAGLSVQAIPYWQRAGRRAAEHSAHVEAIGHFTKALELLNTLPETGERLQQELVLQIALGGPLIATKGYGAPEVKEAYARALELCRQLGETPRLLQVLLGLEAFYFMRGEIQTAHQLGERCLRLSQQIGDPARSLQAHWALGQTLSHLGQPMSARSHLEQAIALYDPKVHHATRLQDHGVTSLCYMAELLWFLGYPDQALEKSRAALALAQKLSHAFSMAFAFIFAAITHQFRGEGPIAQEQTEAAITLCKEQRFPVWLAYGTVLQGWVLANQQPSDTVITTIRKGITAWRATGAEASLPLLLTMLAEAYGKAGHAKEGLAVLEEALAIAQKNHERYYEPELYRLKGELLLNAERGTQNDERNTKKKERKSSSIHHSSFIIHRSVEAEACFQRAIAIAREQSTKSLELRAAMSLARLWQQQGKQHAARHILSEIYGWFTEGFETVDLRAAKSLLDQL